MAQNPFDDDGYGSDLVPKAQSANPFDDDDYGLEPKTSVGGRLKDLGLSVAKGVIGVPEAAVGLADIATGGRAGKFLENEGGSIGFRPKQAKEYLSSLQSDAFKAEQQQFQDADGILAKAGVALTNPALIGNALAESAPLMLGGGAVARGIGALAPAAAGRLGTVAAGEGAVMAGSQAEQIRQQTEDGLLTPTQSALAAGTGVVGAGLGAAGGAIARRLGVGDIDQMIAGGTTAGGRQGLGMLNRAGRGALTEGVFEELPQSLAETGLQNLALDRPFTQDMDSAAVMGTLTGSVMGAGAGVLSGGRQQRPPEDQAAPPAAAPTQQAVDPLTGEVAQVAAEQPPVAEQPAAAPAPAAPPEPEITPVTPIPNRPSEAMGINPADGPLSRAAAQAVDSGVSPVATTIQPAPRYPTEVRSAQTTAPEQPTLEPTADLTTRTTEELREVQRNAQDPAIRRVVSDELRRRREAERAAAPDPLQPSLLNQPQGEPAREPSPPQAVESRQKEPQAPARAPLGQPLTDSGLTRTDSLRDLIQGEQDARRANQPAPEPAAANAASSAEVPQAAGQATGALIDSSLNRDSSWIIRNKDTGEVIMETFDKKKVDALNTSKYEAVPALEYLQGLNKKPDGERPRNWRGNRIQAGKVAKDLGIPTEGKRLAQIVSEIDAVDAGAVAQNNAPQRRKELLDSLDDIQGSTRKDTIDYRIDRLREDISSLQQQQFTEEFVAEAKQKIEDLQAIRAEAVARDDRDLRRGIQRTMLQGERDELNAAVRNGEVTQDQADAIVERARGTGNTVDAVDSIQRDLEQPAREPQELARQPSKEERQKAIDAEMMETRKPVQVAQPTPVKRITFETMTLNGPKKVSGRLYELPGYEGPQLAVVEYKTSRGTGFRVYMPKSGAFITDSNGVSTLADTLQLAVLRVRNARETIAKRNVQNPPQGTSRTEAQAPAVEAPAPGRGDDAATAGVPIQARAGDGQEDGVKPEGIAEAANQAATSPNNDLPQPTDAQKEAGNYQKGHKSFNGFDISIENPAGSRRRPEWPPLKNHYGYFKGSTGADKDHVDVFLTDRADDTTLPVFVVDQVNKDGTFDEHKVIMGTADEAEARATYLQNYEKGWTGLGAITQMSQDEFKSWVRDPAKTKKPVGLKRGIVAKAAEAKAKRVAEKKAAQPTEQAPQAATPVRPNREDAPVSSRDGQMRLADRGGRIATLKLMNNQLRAIAPNEAWADSAIEDATDSGLDALQNSISRALVAATRGDAAQESQPESALRAELEELSGAELKAIFDRMGLAGTRMTTTERVNALMAKDEAEVRAAMQPAEAPQAPEPAASTAYTQADAQAAESQLAQQLGARIDAMQATEVQRIARKFLPTMGIKMPAGKTRIKAAVLDFTKVNPLAAASEFGVEVPDAVRRPLERQMEGRLVEASPQPAPTQPFEHAGLKIRQSRVRVGDEVETRWIVQSPENAEREARGERQVSGDRIVGSREQAIQTAEQEAQRYAREKADRAEFDRQEQEAKVAEEARKEANRGKSIVQRRIDAVLDKPSTLPPSMGLGGGSKREAMQRAVDEGRLIREVMVRDTAAKKRDEDAVARVRGAGYILGLSNENIPVVKAGLEAQARLKANKYEKPEYRVYAGSSEDSPFREISKTEYDYAKSLTPTQPAAQADGQESRQVPPVPVDGYRLERFYANGAKVKPLPAKKFSPAEVQAIKDWFVSIGWNVTPASGENGVNATNDIGMTLDDLPESYTAAQRKKDEAQKAADERAADKQKAQDDYLASTEAGKFVSAMFGDAMNRFNQTALAKVLSGDEKVFGGLFSSRAADVLAEAGIATEGREVKDVIKDIKARFDQAQQPQQADGQGESAQENAAAPAPVSDFGEKLPPARRALAAKLSDTLTDEAIASQPLSKIWPLEENEAIEDKFIGAVAHVMREAVPAKPRTAYKVKTWVEKVKMLRDFTAVLLRGNITKDRFMSGLQEKYSLRSLGAKIKLLEQIDRAQWNRIGDVTESPNAISYEDGKPVPRPSANVYIDGKSHWLKDSGDLNDHMDAIKALLAGDAPETRMQFEIRQERSGAKKVFINKKGDKSFRRLMEFDTVPEARAAIKDKYQDLVTAWDEVKSRDNITERDLRTDENRARTGKDWRKGRDVSAEEFQTTFGFRGGEFGKWVGQGKGAQERQFMLNSSYDALMDLSEILGIPPRAVSLEGTLGIAFGSRGGGWASAHFEPSNLVINLTKPRGAGALAHEWFHALDNYFARKRGGEVPMRGSQAQYRNDNYITHKTRPMMVRKDGKGTPITRERLAEWRKQSPTSSYLAEDQWIPDPNHKDGVRAEVEERFDELVKVLDASPMLKRSRLLEGSKEGDGYWSRTLERAARSFENFVQARMMEQGYHNDFLANVKAAPEVGKNVARYPYLLPDEVAPIATAFDNLFQTIQTRETEGGNVAMFDVADNPQLRMADPTQRATPAETSTATPENQRIVASLSDSINAQRAVKGSPAINFQAVEPAEGAAGQLARAVAKTAKRIFNREIVYVKFDGQPLFNGAVSKLHPGKIFVNIDSERPFMAVLGHELLHELAKSNPGTYANLSRRLNRVMRNQNIYSERLKAKYRQQGQPLPVDILEELEADIVGDNFMDPLFWQEMSQEQPGLFRAMASQIIRWLDNVAARITRMRPFGTDEFLTDIAAARSAVADAMREFSQNPNAPVASTSSASLSVADRTPQTETAAFKRWFGDWQDPLAFSSKRDKNKPPVSMAMESGRPMVLYHATNGDFNTFEVARPTINSTTFGDVETQRYGVFATQDMAFAEEYFRGRDGANIMPVYMNVKSPVDLTDGLGGDVITDIVENSSLNRRDFYDVYTTDLWQLFDGEFGRQVVDALKKAGYDGAIMKELSRDREREVEVWVAFEPSQVKSATGNQGTFDPENPDIRFSIADAGNFRQKISEVIPPAVYNNLTDLTDSQRGLNRWWHRTVGTQLHKAKVNKPFGKVYYAVQDFMRDVSRTATIAADKAPTLLKQIESLGDVARTIPMLTNPAKMRGRKASLKQASDALFDGTLKFRRNGRGEVVEATDSQEAGIVWTREELKERGASDEAIQMYFESRAAIDQSLDTMLAADVYRVLTATDPELVVGDPTQWEAFTDSVRKAVASDTPLDGVSQVIDAVTARTEVFKGQIASLRKLLAKAEGEEAVLIQAAMKEPSDKLEAAEKALEQMTDKQERIQNLQARGYAPLMRFGEYAVGVTNEAGERVFFGLYESQRAANQAARKFRDQGLTVSQSIMSKREFEQLKGLSPETAMLFAEMLGVEKNEAMQTWLQNAVAEQSALKRHIRRKGVSGFDDDASRVLAAFITSNSRAASRAIHGYRIEQAVENVQAGDVKDEAIALADYVNNPREEAQTIRSLLFVNYIGGSVSSALVNLTQTFVQTYPFLSQYGGAVKAGQRVTSAMKQALGKVTDPELSAALKRAEADGIVKPQEVFQLQAEASRNLGSNLYARTALAAWGSFFQLAEQYNRRVAFIAAYNTAKGEGIANPFDFAENAVEESQGVFNKGNRPNWARGAVGATLFTFKGFTIQYVEFLKRLPPKERAIALGVLFLMAGAGGLPFAEDVEDLVDTVAQAMGYNFTSKSARDTFLRETLGNGWATFIQNGVSPWTPFDVSQRLGMADLLPGTALLKKSETRKDDQVLEIFGVAGSFVRDALKGEIRPIAVRNAAKAVEMYDMGIYRDTRGRTVMEVDALDALLKSIGLQPSSVARESRAVGLQYEKKALFQKVKSGITEQMALGYFENDPDKIAAAQEALRSWNQKNPEAPIVLSAPAVWSRVRQMRMDRTERFIKAAPKELRGQMSETLR